MKYHLGWGVSQGFLEALIEMFVYSKFSLKGLFKNKMLLCGTVPDTTKNKTYASILTFQDGSDGTSLDGNVELSRDMQPFCSFWWNEEEIFETKTNKDKGTWGFYLFIRPYFAKVERNSSNNVPQLLGYLESHVYWLFPASRRRGGEGGRCDACQVSRLLKLDSHVDHRPGALSAAFLWLPCQLQSSVSADSFSMLPGQLARAPQLSWSALHQQ